MGNCWLEIRGQSPRALLGMLTVLPNRAGFEVRLGSLGPGKGYRNGPFVGVIAWPYHAVIIQNLLPGQEDQIVAGLEQEPKFESPFEFRQGAGGWIASETEGEG